MSLLLQFCEVNSFTVIINEETAVLNEKVSISEETFFIHLCKVFKEPSVGFELSILNSSELK